MRGNSHVQFLGGGVRSNAALLPAYTSTGRRSLMPHIETRRQHSNAARSDHKPYSVGLCAAMGLVEHETDSRTDWNSMDLCAPIPRV